MLTAYQLNLEANYGARLRQQHSRQRDGSHSSCLSDLGEIAGTPIVRARPAARLIERQLTSKQLLLEDLTRGLTIWQSHSIDHEARLNGQLAELKCLVGKLLNAPHTSGAATKVDVFTRLYQQTPARYKFQPKEVARPLMSTAKVSALKRLFTPEVSTALAVDQQQCTPRSLNVSAKVKNISAKLFSRDPHFVAKMAQWDSNRGSLYPEQATRLMSAIKSSKAAKQAQDQTGPLVKRQLFQ